MAFWLSSRRKLLSILQKGTVMTTLTPQNPVFDGREYAASRPSYPEELFHAIYDYHTKYGGQWETAIDVACGTGQATASLAKRFRKVYGLRFEILPKLTRLFVYPISRTSYQREKLWNSIQLPLI